MTISEQIAHHESEAVRLRAQQPKPVTVEELAKKFIVAADEGVACTSIIPLPKKTISTLTNSLSDFAETIRGWLLAFHIAASKLETDQQNGSRLRDARDRVAGDEEAARKAVLEFLNPNMSGPSDRSIKMCLRAIALSRKARVNPAGK